MTNKQFRDALERLQLTQAEAASLVKADARTGRRWALGERPVPRAVGIIFTLLVRGKIKPKDLESCP